MTITFWKFNIAMTLKRMPRLVLKNGKIEKHCFRTIKIQVKNYCCVSTCIDYYSLLLFDVLQIQGSHCQLVSITIVYYYLIFYRYKGHIDGR